MDKSSLILLPFSKRIAFSGRTFYIVLKANACFVLKPFNTYFSFAEFYCRIHKYQQRNKKTFQQILVSSQFVPLFGIPIVDDNDSNVAFYGNHNNYSNSSRSILFS